MKPIRNVGLLALIILISSVNSGCQFASWGESAESESPAAPVETETPLEPSLETDTTESQPTEEETTEVPLEDAAASEAVTRQADPPKPQEVPPREAAKPEPQSPAPAPTPKPAPAPEPATPETPSPSPSAETSAEPSTELTAPESNLEPREVEPDSGTMDSPQIVHDVEPEPELPEIIEVVLDEGTLFELELLTALDSSINRVGDEIQARTLSPTYIKGEEVLSEGTYIEGRVTEVASSGRVRGRASLAFTFDRLSTRTGVVTIQTSYVSHEAEANTKDDAKKVGGAAGVGAIIGGIIGGKKGAAIGATIGGAGGAGVVLSTKGDEVRLRVGTVMNVRLDEAVVITLN